MAAQRTAQGRGRLPRHARREDSRPGAARQADANFPIGCKRQLVSNEWFDTLIRPNVEVIDTPIAAVTETGLRTKDGAERRVDAFIYGTGFTPTEYLQPMTVTGLGGRDINAAWREGAEAYLG